MVVERRVAAAQINVDGTPLREDLYASLNYLKVEESVQLPDAVTLRFNDPHFELFDEAIFSMGSVLEVSLQGEGPMTRVTTAEVTSIAMDQAPGARHELVVTAYDATHRLHRGPKSRTFVQVTDGDIASQIAGDHSLTADVDGNGEVHEYVVQANQTDFAFLAGRARAAGFDLWIAEETLHFRERPDGSARPPTLTSGENLHRFRVRFSSADRCDEVVVRAWDSAGRSELVGRASERVPGTTATAAEEIHSEATQSFGSVQRSAESMRAATQREADAIAQSLMTRASSAEVMAQGEARGDPNIGPGVEVTIEGVGSRLSGEYFVSSVQHIYGANIPYKTRFVCGARDSFAMTDLVRGQNERAQGNWGGLALAEVSDINDPEGLGRVKVRFVDLESTESWWAPVASPGAGGERGMMLVPEVGDIVIVGFEHGDPRFPYVLGGVWNGEDAPPEDSVEGGSVASRTWKSRAGHHLQFVDDGETSITLKMGDGDPGLVLKDAESTLTGSQKLGINAQEITIEAQAKLVLKAPQIEIDGSGEVKVSGGMIRLN